MPSTEERLRKLVDNNLELEGRPQGRPLDINSSLREAGVSSVDFVNFTRLVAQEFGVDFKPEECTDVNTVGELITLLESRSG